MKAWLSSVGIVCLMHVQLLALSADQERRAEAPAPLQIPVVEGSKLRPITNSDLLGVRDCEGASISPDGGYVAFVAGQAGYETNDYRSALFIASTWRAGKVLNLGTAGLPHWDSINQWAQEAPQWSPDSRFITYRMRRFATETWQIWRWNREGGPPVQLTHVPGDVTGYHWTADGSRLVMTIQRSRAPGEVAELSAHGILYDGKVDPWTSLPIVEEVLARRSTPVETWIYEFSTSSERLATPGETAVLGPWVSDLDERLFDVKQETFQGHHIIDAQKSPSGQWVAYRYLVDDPAQSKSFQENLFSKPVRGGMPIKLAPDTGAFYVGQYWWSGNNNKVYFSQFAPDGRAAKLMVVDKEGGTPRLLFRNQEQDSFGPFSVDEQGRFAACESENNTTPPRIVVIDLMTGRIRALVNLNPEFKNIELSQPTRIEGTNRYGDTWFAHVVKPIGYKTGNKYPLIVTTYRSGDYFLRGASGNENPIQVYAANGFVVLSFDAGYERNIRPGDFQTKLLRWASPTASIEMAVRQLIDEGLVDAQRVGISGYSYGEEIVGYALTHTDLFRAASGAGTHDPYFYYMGGEAWHSQFSRWGLGGWPEGKVKAEWEELAASLRADKIHAAVLNNVSDSEYVADLALQTSLEQLGKPAEMVIYPGELHVINQPKHRYEIYERNLDWFRFWLKGEEDTDPGKSTQYERWRRLRDQAQPVPDAIR
jgi:dipeptidyl aminopeptidase/acylaminoacyl peptidase